MKLVTAEQMREMDRLAIDTIKIPGIVLMENAGAGATEVIEDVFEDELDFGAIILCGPGNNGGDGYVIARHLYNRGYDVAVFQLGAKSALKGDARTNLKIVENLDIPIYSLLKERDLEVLEEALDDCGLVVDALFGTGLSKPIEGLAARVIDLVNDSDVAIVAVDIPSGLGADTGQPLGPVIMADLTATFGLPKVGQFLYPGAEICGEVEVIDIAIPSEVEERVYAPAQLIDWSDVLPLFEPRDADTHKGTYGHAVVFGGSAGMSGAAVLAGQAALVMGAGLVTVAVPEPLLPIMENNLIECLKTGLPAQQGQFAATALQPASALLAGKTVAALGPGLGRGAGVDAFVCGLVAGAEVPLVIDADALNALADDPSILNRAKATLVLTPHPGEMARLLNTTVEEVRKDRVGCAVDLAKRTKAIVVLKGAGTVVAAPDGRIWINATGNPGMASGGMGDVLTGMIASLIAQGVDPLDAAVAGVYLHGYAGDLARESVGERALTASEVIEALPLVTSLFEEIMDPAAEWEDEDE
ncbi:MAG TPA: NAD(P)H-hydrate dehydratase [bacterium]|nr:NAD(P)H-hydrate dehydratase [bacterium]